MPAIAGDQLALTPRHALALLASACIWPPPPPTLGRPHRLWSCWIPLPLPPYFHRVTAKWRSWTAVGTLIFINVAVFVAWKLLKPKRMCVLFTTQVPRAGHVWTWLLATVSHNDPMHLVSDASPAWHGIGPHAATGCRPCIAGRFPLSTDSQVATNSRLKTACCFKQ